MRRKLLLENLENRCLMASLPFEASSSLPFGTAAWSLPYGASPSDTGEFMLGRIAVTAVFIESSGARDVSTEDWNPAHQQEVLDKIESGLDWWRELLATKSSKHTLEFVIDRTFADAPFVSQYEPINRRSNDYSLFVDEFLSDRGFQESGFLETNMRAFNHAQRQRLQTDWSFTIFVVNSQNDGEGTFAPGGSFNRAFSFAGGLFEVIPSTRPASTFTHETGHMFWARDEYIGSGNYYQRRGYYNAQNTNAIDLNPNQDFIQVDSIMSEGDSLTRAFDQLTTSDATLAQLGWVDSDGDGIFDVLDVPLSLSGFGRLDLVQNEYVFQGDARAQALPNLNSSGQQNDITLNRVERIEYRFNSGPWTTFSTPNAYETELNLRIPVPSGTQGTIEVRAIDTRLGILSNVFVGVLGAGWSTTETDGVYGFAWNDQNGDGVWQALENGVAGATVRLEDSSGQPLRTQTVLRTGSLPEGQVTNPVLGATISSVGMDADGRVGVVTDSDAVLDTSVFRPYSWQLQGYRDSFRGTDSQLRIAFARPTNYVFVHAIAAQAGTIARLDAYNGDGVIVARAESPQLALDQNHGLEVEVTGETIAYVVAYGHRETAIKVDQVRFGHSAETTTDVNGAYQFPNVPPSNVVVRITPPTAEYGNTIPADGVRAVTVPEALSVRSDFGLQIDVSPWQNQAMRLDVNNDGSIDLFDALVLINEINRNGARELGSSTAVPPPFIDVDGNRIVDALDVLIVINFINANTSSGEGESSWMGVDIDAPEFDDLQSSRRRRRA